MEDGFIYANTLFFHSGDMVFSFQEKKILLPYLTTPKKSHNFNAMLLKIEIYITY